MSKEDALAPSDLGALLTLALLAIIGGFEFRRRRRKAERLLAEYDALMMRLAANLPDE